MVIRFFIERHQMNPARLRASGYADARPRFENDTDEHRYHNRRVEILIKPVMITKKEVVNEAGERVGGDEEESGDSESKSPDRQDSEEKDADGKSPEKRDAKDK
jgi:hypothetical protein